MVLVLALALSHLILATVWGASCSESESAELGCSTCGSTHGWTGWERIIGRLLNLVVALGLTDEVNQSLLQVWVQILHDVLSLLDRKRLKQSVLDSATGINSRLLFLALLLLHASA